MEKAGSARNKNCASSSVNREAPGQMRDENIIEMFFRRMEEAVFYTKMKYGQMCRNVARRILSDERDVDECENDVYVKVWGSVPPDRPVSLKAYLAKITRNLALDRYGYNTAAQRSTALTEAFEELEMWLPISGGDPGENVDANHLREVINSFLRKQPQEARIFFVRRYWYGESVKEIAEELGVGESKVKTSLFRTRGRLKEELLKERIML